MISVTWNSVVCMVDRLWLQERIRLARSSRPHPTQCIFEFSRKNRHFFEKNMMFSCFFLKSQKKMWKYENFILNNSRYSEGFFYKRVLLRYLRTKRCTKNWKKSPKSEVFFFWGFFLFRGFGRRHETWLARPDSENARPKLNKYIQNNCALLQMQIWLAEALTFVFAENVCR